MQSHLRSGAFALDLEEQKENAIFNAGTRICRLFGVGETCFRGPCSGWGYNGLFQ